MQIFRNNEFSLNGAIFNVNVGIKWLVIVYDFSTFNNEFITLWRKKDIQYDFSAASYFRSHKCCNFKVNQKSLNYKLIYCYYLKVLENNTYPNFNTGLTSRTLGIWDIQCQDHYIELKCFECHWNRADPVPESFGCRDTVISKHKELYNACKSSYAICSVL